MKKKFTMYGLFWWAFAVATMLFAWLTGGLVGKILEKIAIRFALSAVTSLILWFVTTVVTCFGVFKLVSWAEDKLFEPDWIIVPFNPKSYAMREKAA